VLSGPARSTPAARHCIRIALLAALAVVAACRQGAPAEPEPERRFSFTRITFDPRGVSPPLRVAVPERTRSLTVVVRGAPGALYALAELETADGLAQVGLPAGTDLPAAMREAYFGSRSGVMRGRLRQSVRLGLFTAVFPDRPGAALPAGDVVVRIATTDRSHPVAVDLLLPEEDGGSTLPVNVVLVSAGSAASPGRAAAPSPEALAFAAPLRAILAGGGVDLRIERVLSLSDAGLAAMTELSEPQEPPDGASARLALAGGALVDGDALNLFVIDVLPEGVGGWTLGTPGPPLPDTVYSGVIAARLDGRDRLARVLAHEIGHYLGLWHVEHTARSGALHRDPLDDTRSGAGNLMDEDGAGTALSPDQRFALSRHPLLRAP
jgi:hypothetical protein